MKSPSIINYEIRPCKFTERRILLSSLLAITNRLNIEYQYIGFGGLAFTDFKLFHKELGINTMYSIEACYSGEKIAFNKPYSCINVLHYKSTEALLKIDLTRPSIVWLDYDGELTMDAFTDISILFNQLPEGSIYILTCNRQLINEEADPQRPYTNEEFENVFKELVPYNIEKNCCSEVNSHRTIKSMVDAYCERILRDRNKLQDRLFHYKPLYNFRYHEQGGAKMFTTGGIIIGDDIPEAVINQCHTEFIGDDVIDISIPNLTRRESLCLNQIMNNEALERDVIQKSIIKEKDIDNYKKFYKYMPNFYDVRL